MKILLELELDSNVEINNLIEELKYDTPILLNNEEIKIELKEKSDSLAFDGSLTIELIISYTTDVSIGIVANTIYSMISDGIKKLEINGQRTRITKDSIAQTIDTINKMATIMLIDKQTEMKINETKKKSKKRKK